jgi:hypothetical protein
MMLIMQVAIKAIGHDGVANDSQSLRKIVLYQKTK